MRYPLIWYTVAFLVGVVLGRVLPWSAAVWLWLILIFWGSWGLIRLLVKDNKNTITLVVGLLAVLTVGAFRFNLAEVYLNSNRLIAFNDDGKYYAMEGVIRDFPEVQDRYIQVRLDVESLTLEGLDFYEEVSGETLVRLPLGTGWHYGDRVIVRGRLETPPEDESFSYREYLARHGIVSLVRNGEGELLEKGQGGWLLGGIFTLKEKMLALVFQFYPDPEASLAAGILLGEESGIPENVEQAFQDTGTSHVIAISGVNITIIAGLFFMWFSRWFGQNWGRGLAVAGIVVYVVLVGADAAVVRAALMGGLGLLARHVGRRQMGVNTLMVTAAVMALWNPLVLWDVGFQLSFAATLGLILYAEPLTQAFVSWTSKRMSAETVDKLVQPVSEYFLLTLAAQITTLPLIVFHFQRFSLTSLPANIAILPAQPPIMVLGWLGLLVGLIWPGAGQLVSYIVWPFIAYTVRLVEWFAQFRGGVWVLGEVSGWLVGIFFMVLLIVTIWPKQILARLPAPKPGLVFSGLFVVTMLVWRTALAAPDGNLHVTMLDVGMGDAFLVQTPEGRYVLIGGGPSASRLSDGLGRRVPLGTKLDYLVVASPIEEQVAGLLRGVERYTPQQVLWAGETNISRSGVFLRDALTDSGVGMIEAEAGMVLDLGQGAGLEVLVVGEEGSVLMLAWENFRMLLPLGVGKAELNGLGHQVGVVSVYVLAGNGKASANPINEIRAINPDLVLLGVDAGNFAGLPEQDLLDNLEDFTILRTDQDGWVHVWTDGDGMWVEKEK